MIAPENFVILADYAQKLRWAYEELFESHEYDPETDELVPPKMDYLPSFPLQLLVEESLHEILWKLPNIWAYSVGGVCHKISKDVLYECNGRDENGLLRRVFSLFHVDEMKIDIGKLANLALPFDSSEKKSGFMRDKIHSVPRDFDLMLATRFASLDGFYLTVPEGVLPDVAEMSMLKILCGDSSSKREAMDVDQVRSRLRSAAEKGKLPRRDKFRLEFAPEMKVDVFKAIWREVSQQYPQLSRPGPKPNSKS